MTISPYLKALREKVGTDLMMLPAVSVLIFRADGAFLLHKRRDTGLWATIGGAIEPYEQPADAAVREAWEETGLHVDVGSIVAVLGGSDEVVVYPHGDQVAYINIVFTARVFSGTPQADGEEADELGWFTLDEARALETTIPARGVLNHVHRTGNAAWFHPPQWSPPR